MFHDGDLAQMERTLAVVLDERKTLAHAYLNRLFEVRPEMRRHFNLDPSAHAGRFMGLINSALLAIEVPEAMAAALHAMGAEHADWGIREDFYDDMIAAILWAFERCAGPDWDEAAAGAWGRLLAWVRTELAAGLREETARMALDQTG